MYAVVPIRVEHRGDSLQFYPNFALFTTLRVRIAQRGVHQIGAPCESTQKQIFTKKLFRIKKKKKLSKAIKLKNCLIARKDSKKTSSRVGEEFEIREESREQSADHKWSAVHKYSLRAD